jgi:hypothetical protein
VGDFGADSVAGDEGDLVGLCFGHSQLLASSS